MADWGWLQSILRRNYACSMYALHALYASTLMRMMNKIWTLLTHTENLYRRTWSAISINISRGHWVSFWFKKFEKINIKKWIEWSFRLTRSLRPLSLFPRFNDGALITRTSAEFKSIVASPLNLRCSPTQLRLGMCASVWVCTIQQFSALNVCTVQHNHNCSLCTSHSLSAYLSPAKACVYCSQLRLLMFTLYTAVFMWLWSKRAAISIL